MLNPTLRRASLALALVVALLGGGAATASAHIQVNPTLAAPEDAVKFTVLVPGERAPKWTKEVILKVPAGVLPYSFEATPGWSRQIAEAKNGAIDRVIWKGRLAPDGFVEFSFLAATPPQPGKLAWKALQVYNDGQVVRWIGAPNSEDPAPVTVISADAPLQNAGGEGTSGSSTAAPASIEATTTETEGDGGGSDGLARGLAIAALAIAVVGLLFIVRTRKERQ